mmetsp:Transcript_22930/g.68778  ORF Transcript_22930/g.68778 Transcript_22930/m.68778 type:complete len:219 (+) Transcript_22930:312-968(+)
MPPARAARARGRVGRRRVRVSAPRGAPGPPRRRGRGLRPAPVRRGRREAAALRPGRRRVSEGVRRGRGRRASRRHDARRRGARGVDRQARDEGRQVGPRGRPPDAAAAVRRRGRLDPVRRPVRRKGQQAGRRPPADVGRLDVVAALRVGFRRRLAVRATTDPELPPPAGVGAAARLLAPVRGGRVRVERRLGLGRRRLRGRQLLATPAPAQRARRGPL